MELLAFIALFYLIVKSFVDMLPKLFTVKMLEEVHAPYEDHFNKEVIFVKKKMLSTKERELER